MYLIQCYGSIFKQLLEVFYKKICKNFAIFTGKHKCLSLFFRKLKACNFVKERLQQRCFSVNIAKLLRTAIFEKHLRTAASVHFKIKRHIQQPVKYLRYFCQKLVGRCLTGFRVHGKKAFKVLSFLLPLIKFVKLVKAIWKHLSRNIYLHHDLHSGNLFSCKPWW